MAEKRADVVSKNGQIRILRVRCEFLEHVRVYVDFVCFQEQPESFTNFSVYSVCRQIFHLSDQFVQSRRNASLSFGTIWHYVQEKKIAPVVNYYGWTIFRQVPIEPPRSIQPDDTVYVEFEDPLNPSVSRELPNPQIHS